MALSKENYLKRQIKFNSLIGSKENMFQYCKNNTDSHEDIKYLIFKTLIKRNHKVFTEVEFKDGKGRADIIAFEENTGNGHIIEIVHSEKESSIKEKINKYPIDFDLTFIYTNKLILNQLPI